MRILVWNDPDPIPGNDYTVEKLELKGDDGKNLIYDIYYGGGSYAQVYGHELEIIDDGLEKTNNT